MTNDTVPHENGVADQAAIAAIAGATDASLETSSSEEPAPPKPPSFDDLGLHRDAERARFARYCARFDVPAEA